MEMEKIKVIIIDSGVNKNHPKLIEKPIKGFSYKDGRIYNDFDDTYGHGTAVYNIIKNAKNVEITNIKVDNIENGIEDRDIIGILEYIYENLEANIINLSLGLSLCENIKELYSICDKLYKKGVIIISSFDNAGSMSYPAAFDNVIGVTTGTYCTKVSDYEFIDDTVINIAAYGSIQRLAWVEPSYIFIGGNSFACAHVTTIIANLMQKGIVKREEIFDVLKEKSIRQYKCKNYYKEEKIPFKIEKAALFPFNKEMHSLIRYSDMLSFKITSVYDSKYSGRVGTSTNHLLNDDNVQSLKIENINNINWDEFDTLIIGHIEELSTLLNREELIKELVEQGMKYGKNIYALDDISELVLKDKKDYIYFPKIDESSLPEWRYGKLFRISKPVLGVFGTSSKQGKFTLQLQMRKVFMEKGFKIGQIGTEPTALLYGMDAVYPMGYNSSVYIKEFDSIRYLNYVMNDISMKDNDIIIVGSQSGTVTYDNGNISLFNVPQYHFLMGTQPDTVVLCINPYDDFNYIDKTIKFIESSVETRVVAIVLFPMDLSSSWTGIYGKKEPIKLEKFEMLKEKLMARFNLPVFKLGSSDIDKLVDYIIKFYSE